MRLILQLKAKYLFLISLALVFFPFYIVGIRHLNEYLFEMFFFYWLYSIVKFCHSNNHKYIIDFCVVYFMLYMFFSYSINFFSYNFNSIFLLVTSMMCALSCIYILFSAISVYARMKYNGRSMFFEKVLILIMFLVPFINFFLIQPKINECIKE